MNANFTEKTKFHPWVLALAIAGLLALPLSGGGMQDRVASGGEEEVDWTLAKGKTETEEEEVDWTLANNEDKEDETDWTLASNDRNDEDEVDWTLA